MKIASIDIGTNSMRLLIADYNKTISNRKKTINTTRIGQGINKDGFISKDAINRNLDSFINFVNTAKTDNAEYIYAIGTSALRDSKNKEEFVELAKINTGIEIEIINGNTEAELGFYGVAMGVDDTEKLLIIDIGGGSTEFVVGSKQEGVIYKESIDIGAVRLTEKFKTKQDSDDVSLIEMTKYINSKISHLYKIITTYNIKKVIGIGGTITTASSINQNMKTYDTNKIHNSLLKVQDVEYMLNSLNQIPLRDRKKVVGLDPARADIIVSGLNILICILKCLNVTTVTVSEYDNLEGLMYYKLSLNKIQGE
ncbi:Ppx/GppA phosphatase family protein [Proteocatella sphenisci]|uniref:Ppx/GppA phosphatase family protein n=1 Tax=Proteocatella sphenisci TaxID=181070 RepID=UPI000490C151|nr:Ppx/GppA phosphatase family protein [Proteocatella sphenisci]